MAGKDRDPRHYRRNLILVALFAALSGVLAHIQIPLPFTPVPVTGQTLAPMLAGLLLGPRLGALTQLVYMALGLVGLPVFAGGTAGIGQILGPTGGYLFGLVLGAAVTGAVARADWGHRLLRYGTATVLGGIFGVYAVGVPWLAYSLQISIGEAVVAGALPFLVGDGLKAFAAALLAHRLAMALPSWRSA